MTVLMEQKNTNKKTEKSSAPQIKVTPSPSLKMVYDLVGPLLGADGQILIKAGFLMLVEHPELRHLALSRLDWFETDRDAPRSAEGIREWLSGIAKFAPVDVEVQNAVSALEKLGQERRRSSSARRGAKGA